MRVTQSQIAKHAGVSRSLVSMALGGSTRVDSKTRKHILAIAEELGYRPNMLVKGIQTGRSMTVGVVLRSQRAFFGQMLAGIQETLENHDYLPIVLSASERYPVISQINRLLDQRVDGIIIKPEEQLYAADLENVMKHNIPLVSVDNLIAGDANYDFSGSNEDMVGRLVAEHLMDLGHSNFGVVTVKNAMHLQLRSDSFKRTVANQGAECHVFEAEGYGDYNWIHEFEKTNVSALFFIADTMAAQFLKIIQADKRSLPACLSVVGCANMELGEYCQPELTTIEQFPYRIGVNAATLLLDRMTGGVQYGQRQLLESPALIVRNSSVPFVGE